MPASQEGLLDKGQAMGSPLGTLVLPKPSHEDVGSQEGPLPSRSG